MLIYFIIFHDEFLFLISCPWYEKKTPVVSLNNTEKTTINYAWKITIRNRKSKLLKKRKKKDSIPKVKQKIIKKKKQEKENSEEENNYESIKAKNNNKEQHIKNGNRKNINHYKILQVNTSHANYNTKIQDLRLTINEQESQIVVISEANMNLDDSDNLEERRKTFVDIDQRLLVD